MSAKKKYIPHCPSRSCNGGHEGSLHHFDLFRHVRLGQIPADAVSLKKGEAAYRCSYCGLVWFQKTKKLGFDPLVVGYYDSPQYPGFRPVGPFFEHRRENLA